MYLAIVPKASLVVATKQELLDCGGVSVRHYNLSTVKLKVPKLKDLYF